MSNPLINPNWHVILIHYPLGIFVLGLLLEVILLLFRHHGSVRRAVRWMVVIGALSALPAAYSGLYALADVVGRSSPASAAGARWEQVVRTSSLTGEQWRLLEKHAWTNGGAAVIAALLVTLAVACSDRLRQRLYLVFLVLLLGCAGAMGVGAFHGGEMVYREGLAVNWPGSKSELQTSTRPTSAQAYMNPVQTHITLAGVVAALGLLGIGLSLRAATTSPHWQDPELDRAGVAAMPNPQRGGAEDMLVLRSFAPRVEVTGETERIPTGRYWLVAFVFIPLTALSGWWMLGNWLGTYRPGELWKVVLSEGNMRRLAHVSVAISIAVLTLGMALLARFARRRHGMIAVFSVLLILAVAAQVWLGALLLLDQSKVGPGDGPWYRFQSK
jgi:hypothetical protein